MLLYTTIDTAQQNIVIPEIQLIYLRQTATFVCNTNGTYQWRKEGRAVFTKYITPRSTLLFTDVTGVERGVYTCMVFDVKSKSFIARGYGELVIGGNTIILFVITKFDIALSYFILGTL